MKDIKILPYWLLSGVLTAITAIFGGVPLKILRHRLGRVSYFVLVLPMAAGFFYVLPIAGVYYFALAVLIELQCEFEDHFEDSFTANFLALLSTMMLLAGAVMLWSAQKGFSWIHLVEDNLALALQSFKGTTKAGTPLTVTDVLIQLPSALAILFSLNLFFANVFEKVWTPRSWKGHAKPTPRSLGNYTVPAYVVWIAIFAVLGAFGKLTPIWLERVCINIVNVCVMLFFFQGFAVTVQFLRILKINRLWRVFFLVFLSLQLFFVLSFIGFVDFWMNFRERLRKRSAQLKSNAEGREP